MLISHDIHLSTDITRTARVAQAEGLFDMPQSPHSTRTWHHRLTLPDQWNIGVIVGPSGSGKSTLARQWFGESISQPWIWPANQSILDGFPAKSGIRELTLLLCSVGFSSPPAWLRPFNCLSTGEQFRVNLARTLAENPALAVVDEFSSVVDRTVARIGSAAVAKSVRRRNQQFVAITCHYDVMEWLEPDWIYEPHTQTFTTRTGPDGLPRSLWRRPPIELLIRRVHSSAWEIFKPYHYLSAKLHPSAQCYVGYIILPNEPPQPGVFVATLPFPHADAPGWREHRCVCLPDYQGIGIGNALSEYVASLYISTGKPYTSTTSHPGMIRHRIRSPLWKITRRPSLKSKHQGLGPRKVNSVGRLTAAFRYIGPPRLEEAKKLLRLSSPIRVIREIRG